ncbi:MAG: signal peptidase I [Eubacteriales bacterium]|nr:signal peptidase I [Eubacteriales bacterium]
MMRKIIYGFINILSVLIIVAAVIVLCIVLMTKPGEPPNIFGYTALRVTTGSMEPTYGVDTLILVKETDPAAISEGDVISFYSSDPALDGAVNTHRVVEVRKDGDNYMYVTKGDANNVPDMYDVNSKYLIGKVVASSLVIGKISRLCANPLIFVPVILIPLAIMLIANVVHTCRLAKKIAKEETEAAVREAIDEIKQKKNAKENQK